MDNLTNEELAVELASWADYWTGYNPYSDARDRGDLIADCEASADVARQAAARLRGTVTGKAVISG